MPIRMKRDDFERDGSPQRRNSGKTGGGSGGGILAFLLPFLFKNPKLLIVAVVLFGAYYFFQGSCNSAPQTNNATSEVDALYKGCEMKPEEYDKAYVFAALSDKEKLPISASLERFCPDPQNQGQQGSCVGWGSAYAARSIMEAVATGNNPNAVAFSPAFLYNQIKLPDCQGAYISKAMEVQQRKGALPFTDFKYNENSCDQEPSSTMLKKASNYNIHGYNRLTKSAEPYGVNTEAIKQNIAKGGPVVIGMMVGGSFMQEMMGNDVWQPNSYDYNKRGFGGHCMCVIGYDDNKAGGAFQIMNSWGPEWGINGKGWVTYNDFTEFCVEAYGIDPLPTKKSAASANAVRVQINLIAIKPSTKGAARYGNTIPLKYNGHYFETGKMAKESLFKMEVKNESPCYVYVLGEETDKTSYVLFPYTEKHSAYCGISGSRIFPSDYNLSPDGIGSQDFFAVIVSKSPINPVELKEKINQSTGTFENKIGNILGTRIAGNGVSTANGIGFNYQASNNADVTYCVIAVNK